MFNKKLAFLSLLILISPLFSDLPAEETDSLLMIYQESNRQGEQVRHHILASDKRFELKTELSGGLEHQVCLLDETGQTREWHYIDSSRDIQLKAVLLVDRRIHLSGSRRGKVVEKYFQINRQPWNQRFQHGLASFLKGEERKTVFWAIGTRGKGELKITRFTVSREDAGSPPPGLIESGPRGPFLQIKISLHGLLAAFWSGHYWYDAAEADFLFYQGKSSYLDNEVVLLREK